MLPVSFFLFCSRTLAGDRRELVDLHDVMARRVGVGDADEGEAVRRRLEAYGADRFARVDSGADVPEVIARWR